MKLSGLKEVRKIFGFTMRDLAKELNVTANAINLWENSGSNVTENRLEMISTFFGIDKELLLKPEHDSNDILTIESARSRYKTREHKSEGSIIINNYYSYVFVSKEINIQIEADEKIQAIEKFNKEYPYLFNQQWSLLEISRIIKIDGSEEKYL